MRTPRTITRAEAEDAARRPLSDREVSMLPYVALGARGQPRMVIDQQSFDLDNDGHPWRQDRAIWYCTMLAIALARLIGREVDGGS